MKDGANLRVIWPQWQGAGTSSVAALAAEFPFDIAEAKSVILEQLARALDVIRQESPAHSHPDIGTGESAYPGYHAMAVSALTGHGDRDVQALLPATVPSEKVALVGLHAWTDDDFPNVADWGIQAFGPDELRDSTAALIKWIAQTGCSRVAVHFDVDTIDSNEIVLGPSEYFPRQVMHLQQLVRGFPLVSG